VHLVGFYYKNISRCTGPLNVKKVIMRFSLFCIVMHRTLVVVFQLFGTACPIFRCRTVEDCTLLINHQYTLCNNSERWTPHLQQGTSL